MNSVTTIRMGFLEQDDRLLVDFVYPASTVTVLITRRITRRIIQGLAHILATSNAAMARVPAPHKTEMLIWEHLSSLHPANSGQSGGGPGGSPPEQPHRPPAPWPLLLRLDLTPQNAAFALRFEAADGAVATIDMNRGELHRLLASLRQLARHGGWDLDAEVGWLVEADSPTVTPGNLAS